MTYSPVYSTQFIVYTNETPNTQFDVPAGNTAVIRYWSVQQDIGGYSFTLAALNSVDAPQYTLDYSEDIGVGLVYRNSGRIVVPGGGIIGIGLSAVGSNTSIYVGGYLLQNVVD